MNENNKNEIFLELLVRLYINKVKRRQTTQNMGEQVYARSQLELKRVGGNDNYSDKIICKQSTYIFSSNPYSPQKREKKRKVT